MKVIEFIVVLRFLATCLITNSHFGNVWPIQVMATGGALGNSLFFFVSGYCISTKQQNFVTWIWRKIIHLYIPIVLVQIFCYMIGIYKSSSIIQVFKMFVFPTNYWFFLAILVGFCVMYLWDNAKIGGGEKRICLSALCAGVMIIRYYAFGISKIGVENDFVVKTAFYILIMQLGYSLRRNKVFAENKNVVNAVGIMIGVIGMYGWKILEGKNAFFYNFQLGEYIFLALFVCSIYAFCVNNEKRFRGLASHKGWRGVRWIAARSWEIYLVQVPLVHHLKLMRFPISLFEMLAMIFLCTFVLGAASRYTMKFITGEALNKSSTAGR